MDNVTHADQPPMNESELRKSLVMGTSVIEEQLSSIDEPELQSCTIDVSGVNKNTSQETVKMFFENRKKSGGGKIEDMWYNNSNGNYVITFTPREGKFLIYLN